MISKDRRPFNSSFGPSDTEREAKGLQKKWTYAVNFSEVDNLDCHVYK